MSLKIPKKFANSILRFDHAKIDNFSIMKSDLIVAGKLIMQPTMLLVDIQSTKNKLVINHAWIAIKPTLLKYNIAIGDNIAFTGKISYYEKRNNGTNKGDRKVVTDLGISNIYNIKILYKEQKSEKSFSDFLQCCYNDSINDEIKNKLILPDVYIDFLNGLKKEEVIN